MVARRLKIAGMSQRVVGDPSEPCRDDADALARGGPSKRFAMNPCCCIRVEAIGGLSVERETTRLWPSALPSGRVSERTGRAS